MQLAYRLDWSEDIAAVSRKAPWRNNYLSKLFPSILRRIPLVCIMIRPANNIFMQSKFLITVYLLFSLVILNACSKSDNTSIPTVTKYLGTLSGANETPPNSSAATGKVDFSYNRDTKILSGTVTYAGITLIAAQIRKGAVGQSGPEIFSLGDSSLDSPISFTSDVLDSTQEADLMHNLYYVNLQTTMYPGGEIRAQLTKQ